MKKIAQNFIGHRTQLILGPAFKLFEAVLELLVPMVMAGIIDVGVAGGDQRYIVTRGLLMLLLGILGFGAAMICQYFAAAASGAFGRSLRNQVYRHVMTLSGGEVAAFGTGGLITRMTNDINQIQTGINMAIRLGSRVPFLAVGSIIMAMRINPRIGLLFLISTPLIILALYLIMRKTLPSYGRVQETQDRLSRLSGENLSGARIIRAFSRQGQEKREYEDASEELTAVTVRVGKISAALNPLTSVIANAAILFIIWLGARFVFNGQMLSGEIIALVSYMNQTLLALIVAANLIVLFTRAIASARRVAAVLDTEPGIAKEPDRAGADAYPEEAVAFDGVRFAYHKNADDALEDISFRIRRGETVGLIGGTGSGKSTIVNLLMRYYDVDEGAIRLIGQDIRAMAPDALRRRIGLAPQTAVLFAGTIRFNLLLSAPDATEDRMWRALEAAQCLGFVREMENGLDTEIREGGKNLSGGQRQRLTIARALIRQPELLILDDAASALDYATDAALRAALAREKRERPEMTVLMISQRAASIMHSDQILVLDDGRLAGTGTHEELLSENAIYREICLSQGIGLEVMRA